MHVSDEEKEIYLTLMGFESYYVNIYDEKWLRWTININGFRISRLNTSAAYEMIVGEILY